MDADRFEEMARDPRFISGVYNYCDRWCERCPFTARCMNYAMGQEEEAGNSRSRDIENEAFWDKLHETFEATMERVEEQIEEMDFDLDEEELEEGIREQEEIHEAAQSQSCSRTARRYVDLVDNWLTLNEGLLDNQSGKAESLPHTGSPGVEPGDDAAGIRDCLEIIRWYQPQIWVKLCRAASGAIRARLEGIESFQEDADGSAKVALIGIERSIAAWGTLLNRFPDHEDAIFSLATLKRLLRQVEAAFPNARAFRRPGFDAEDNHTT
ncbi:MAG: hypothetical protein ABFD90_20200 [Phycisphaerales bacterium]